MQGKLSSFIHPTPTKHHQSSHTAMIHRQSATVSNATSGSAPSTSTKPEFQCVILPPFHQSSASSYFLSPILINHLSPGKQFPSFALPIDNTPFITYQLKFLERYGFDSVIIVVLTKEDADILSNIIATSASSAASHTNIKVDIQVVSSFQGHADILRQIKSKITSDFFVINGDLITDVSLHGIADIHRIHDSCCTVLLKQDGSSSSSSSSTGSSASASAVGSSANADIFKDLIYPSNVKVQQESNPQTFFGLSKSVSKLSLPYARIALIDRSDVQEPKKSSQKKSSKVKNENPKWKADQDKEPDSVVVNKRLLKSVPRIELCGNLQDVNLYLFRHWVLDLLDEKKELVSIHDDLVPFLIYHQFQDVKKYFPESLLSSGVLTSKQALSQSMSSTRNANQTESIDLIRVYAVVLSNASAYCAKAKDLSSYHRINMDMINLGSQVWEKPQILTPYEGKTALVIGRDCRLGDQISIKNCVIGNKCTIGTRAKLNNCIIMDNVTIGNEVVLQNSIICSDVGIADKCNINDCIITNGTVLRSQGARKKGECIIGQQKGDDSDEDNENSNDSDTGFDTTAFEFPA